MCMRNASVPIVLVIYSALLVAFKPKSRILTSCERKYESLPLDHFLGHYRVSKPIDTGILSRGLRIQVRRFYRLIQDEWSELSFRLATVNLQFITSSEVSQLLGISYVKRDENSNNPNLISRLTRFHVFSLLHVQPLIG